MDPADPGAAGSPTQPRAPGQKRPRTGAPSAFLPARHQGSKSRPRKAQNRCRTRPAHLKRTSLPTANSHQPPATPPDPGSSEFECCGDSGCKRPTAPSYLRCTQQRSRPGRQGPARSLQASSYFLHAKIERPQLWGHSQIYTSLLEDTD
ncbi:hypothetical protein HJG60_010882 [Phyllostomus discolor]|uniref:Uncharacterized protein n=1 Tax=Phyllostomus discolor TaxID=89673 RepID=A0A834AC25_9CHIR|nr:hypothetical protein HJG60_010882 [Phyllostomus discolor]